MSRVCRFIWTILPLLTFGHPVGADPITASPQLLPQGELLRQLVEIVLQNNPVLQSQMSVVQRDLTVPEPRGVSAITGLSLNAGIVDYYYSRTDYGYAPTATVGISVSFGDPARALNILKVTQEKEQARQLLENTRNDLVAKLFDSVNQILQLESRKSSISDLKEYLEKYDAFVQSQVKQGMVEPDQLLALKERLANLNVELQDAKNRLGTIRLQTALSLGGKAWEQMFSLLQQVQEFP